MDVVVAEVVDKVVEEVNKVVEVNKKLQRWSRSAMIFF